MIGKAFIHHKYIFCGMDLEKWSKKEQLVILDFNWKSYGVMETIVGNTDIIKNQYKNQSLHQLTNSFLYNSRCI